MAAEIIQIADLFCGAGGTSTGAKQACEKLGYTPRLTAVNHWDVAIATHSDNHPESDHVCADLQSVDPTELVPSGRLKLLCASPECTHHSRARGGKPMSNQKRSSARYILDWAEKLYIENILIENVKEWRDWGPLNASGRPVASKRGQFFLNFVRDLELMDYLVDYREMNAADYGDPTTRVRFFLQARKKWTCKQITWPEPTHHRSAGGAQNSMFDDKRTSWRPARDIIDFSIPSESIFDRKKPLAESTMNRIISGLSKHGQAGEPFVVVLRNHMAGQSIHSPLPTITAGGQHIGICEPFIIPLNHGSKDMRSYSMDRPFPTVTSVDAWAMVEPFVVKFYGTGASASLSDPLDTVTTKDRFGLVTIDGTPYRFDIRFRMLQPKELACAMGFPKEYRFSGNREQQVKQIGNAVPVGLSRALTREILKSGSRTQRRAA